MSNTIAINGQNINIADIQAALKSQGLDIKELARQANALKNGEVAAPKGKAAPCATTFKLALVNYPDFCIERTTAKTRQLIVIMPSCKGYYVKSFRGTDEFIEELTSDAYAKLTSGMNDITLPEDFWIKRMCAGKKFCDNLLTALACEEYLEMIKYHIAPKFEDIHFDRWSSIRSNKYVAAYKNQPALYREFFNTNKAKDILISAQNFINNIVDDFGLNNARDFLGHFELSLVDINSGYGSRIGDTYRRHKLYPDMEMKYDAFRDYVLYQSVFMGYGKTISTFFQEWRDAINMQRDIYHKIREKYHDNLPLWHHQLSYKSACMQEQIDEEKMNEMVALASLYQDVCGKYVFITPTCKQDFLDEAQMQQNCLASYVSKVVNGDCIIMFMRLKDNPIQSLVTIEICKDDKGNYTVINQKYQARNKVCTEEQSAVIDRWLKRAINRVNKKKKGEEIEVDEELTKILKSIEQ